MDATRQLVWLALLAVSLHCPIGEARRQAAGTATDPVEIEEEPFHSIRFANSVIRVYEAQIPVASRTLFHTHRYGGAGIDMTATHLSVEKVGVSDIEQFQTKPGDLFSLDLSEPFSHQVSNTGSVVYRVIVAELQRAPLVGSSMSTVAKTPNYKLELDTDRVRAYRLTLIPGEATPVHTLRAQALIVSISGGQLSVTSSGEADRFFSLAPTALEWIEQDSTITITNVGVSTYQSIYFEWKSPIK